MLTQRKDGCVLQLAKNFSGVSRSFINNTVDREKCHCKECFASGVMGLLLLRLGRVVLLALMLIQGFLLAAYKMNFVGLLWSVRTP